VSIETVSFEGHEGVRLERGATALVVTTSVGPRILGLLHEGRNMLAVLPRSGLELPDGRTYAFLGGHRLWAAPEVTDVTYQPDDRPCEVTEVDGGVRVEAPMDGAGLAKAIELRPTPDGWAIDHVLRNESGVTMTLAPWAVTQVSLGGEVAVPTRAEENGAQANRSLVLWPYTDLGDPRIRLARDEIRVHAIPGGPRLKIGAAPSRGRVSYEMDGLCFDKAIEVDPGAAYADRGAPVQVYLCDEFVELETLGPLVPIEPGGSASHRERWTLRPAGGDAGSDEP
jgi:hypothetical protein